MAELSATVTTPPAPESLTASADARVTSGSAAAPSRGPVALIAESTLGPEADLTAFVRRRVRQVSLLFLIGYFIFLARELFSPPRELVGLYHTGFFVVIPLQIALVALMYSGWPTTMRRVRVVECVGLVALSAFIGVSQYMCLANPEATGPLISDASGEMQVLVGNTGLLPWLVLIIGYSVVVPNPTRRAFLLAVLTAMVPIGVTAAAVMVNRDLGWANTKLMFAQCIIWGFVGVWFAVYGAYQSGRLRQQAYEARRFGQYRLARRLGAGGMGEVYLAEHLLLRRPSVIKVIRAERSGDPAVLKRFEREVQILATLNHWNTVAVFDYGYTADGTFYYVMEYLPGLNLDELVARYGVLAPGRAVHLLRQLCAALNEAHAAGLIHRDVKPSNVMICRRGCVPDVAKLLDFGLVVATASTSDSGPKLTVEGTIMGTPYYMSPEQAASKPADARSDIYSLGATAYFLLTGQPPFARGGAMEIIAAHLFEVPAPLASVNPGVPPDLADVVMRCLGKKPDQRFATVAELDGALAGCSCAAAWDNMQAAEWWSRHNV